MIPSSLGMVPQAQPWASDAIDVESINQTTGQALLLSVRSLHMEAQHQSHPRTRVHLVLGPPGGGKTHLFGRLRRKLGPRATLVHLRPLVGADIRPRYLVGQVFGQLSKITHEVTQIDSLVGSLIARTRGSDVEKPRLMLEDFRRLDPNDQHLHLEHIIEQCLEARSDLDEAVLRALMQLPVLPTLFRTATLSWLGGFELDPAQSARISATGSLPDERLIGALRTLAAIAATTSPLVLVFDQLENLIDASDSDGRVRSYANLIAELVDTVPGLVIIQMAVDSDWARDIEPRLGQAQKSRVLGQKQLLQLPTEAQRTELLQRWVQRIDAPEAPFPWPFTASQVDTWTTAPGMTPRMLLLAAEQALLESQSTGVQENPPEPEALDDRLLRYWQQHIDAARNHLDEAAELQRGPEPEHLHDALLLLGSWLSPIYHTARDGAVCLELDTKPCQVYLLHDVHPRTIAARMRRWLESKGRHVILREQWRPFPTTWYAVNRIAEDLESRPGARFHWVSREDVARLLALRTMVMQARSHDLVDAMGQPVTDATVMQWMRRQLAPKQWPLVAFLTQDVDTSDPVTQRRSRPAESYDKAPDTVRDSQPAHPLASSISERPSNTPGNRPSSPPSARVMTERRVLGVLEHLRVASLDRLAREAAARGVQVTRKQIIEELTALGSAVRWFGRSIVALIPEDRS